MTKKSTTIDANYISNLKANEILEKEAPKKKATKKVAEKSEVKEAPKKKTVKAKKADTVEKVESETSQSTEKPKKVAKKDPKAVEKTADKEPKKTTKKAKAEAVEQESENQEIRPLESIKIAKTEYVKCENVKTYDDLVEMIENEEEVFVAFDISNVDAKEYESIFHVPFEKSMKQGFDVCTPIFVGEKNPRIVFASIYTEALWDLFPDEFELLSAVLIEKPKK